MNNEQKRYTIKRIEKYETELNENTNKLSSYIVSMGLLMVSILACSYIEKYVSNLYPRLFAIFWKTIATFGSAVNLALLIHTINCKVGLELKIEDLQSSIEMEETIEEDDEEKHTLSRRK